MVIVTVAAMTSSTVRWNRRSYTDKNQNNCNDLFRFHFKSIFSESIYLIYLNRLNTLIMILRVKRWRVAWKLENNTREFTLL